MLPVSYVKLTVHAVSKGGVTNSEESASFQIQELTDAHNWLNHCDDLHPLPSRQHDLLGL